MSPTLPLSRFSVSNQHAQGPVLNPRDASFQPGGAPVEAQREQWTQPGDVFSVLLLLGGDVVNRALAQLAGSRGWKGRVVPVGFSFGWVAYATAALVSSVGEGKLMPPGPDCSSIVINAHNGYVRQNSSWMVGRIIRDFEYWMGQKTKQALDEILRERWERDKEEKRKDALRSLTEQRIMGKSTGSGSDADWNGANTKGRPTHSTFQLNSPDVAKGGIRRWLDHRAGTASIPQLEEQQQHQIVDQIVEKQVPYPTRASLCISIYRSVSDPSTSRTPGHPKPDLVYYSGFLIALLQLGISAIPLGLTGDWNILLVTTFGILFSLATGSLPQWRKEKFACRTSATKNVILTRGNGAQHAILVKGCGVGIDFEDLAAADTNAFSTASITTRVSLVLLAALWVFLLISAAGLSDNTWFLLAVGGIGILQNAAVAGFPRRPGAFGVHLEFEDVVCKQNVMGSLMEIERRVPRAGRSMLGVLFPGKLFPREEKEWDVLDAKAEVTKSEEEVRKAGERFERATEEEVDEEDVGKLLKKKDAAERRERDAKRALEKAERVFAEMGKSG
ncbi:MAG: hypothetical protein M1831_006002 [Alyxoria varia]|nr:MAG: hypothetical protein M1831_006002 [Alyxoria varia]